MTDPPTEAAQIAEAVAAKGVTRVPAGKTGKKPAASKTTATKPAPPKPPIGARRFADDAKITILKPIDEGLTAGRKNHSRCARLRTGMTVAEALKVEGGPTGGDLIALVDRKIIEIK
jgi:hypothetical protein